jgi:hypothetical protein
MNIAPGLHPGYLGYPGYKAWLFPGHKKPGAMAGFSVLGAAVYSTALTMSSMTFLASPNTIMVLSI